MKASPPSSFGIIVKLQDASAARKAALLVKKLRRSFPRSHIFMEEAARSDKQLKNIKTLEFTSLHRMTRTCALIITDGCDGTILRCTRYLLSESSWKRCRILGVKAGQVGFLTSLSFEDAERDLPKILKNAARSLKTEKRSCLEVRIYRREKLYRSYDVLNDCVLSKGSLSRIFEFHVDIDNEFLSSYRADGLVISPPTGSTAYNLAAGGAIVEPGIAAMQLTPISPQYFSNKPIVLADHHRIGLRLGRHSTDIFLTMDGHTGLRIEDNDRIVIAKSKKSIQFLIPTDTHKTHYFRSLRQKLNWGLVQRQSA